MKTLPAPISNSPDDWHLAGLEALEAGDVQDAVLFLRRALDLDPNRAAAWNDLGVILEALANHIDAAYCYRRTLQLQPSLQEARCNLAALALHAASRHALPLPVRSRAVTAVAR